MQSDDKKANFNVLDKELDPELEHMKGEAETLDAEEKKKIDEILEQYKKKSDFAKVMEHNNPKSLIVVAIISAAIMGTT